MKQKRTHKKTTIEIEIEFENEMEMENGFSLFRCVLCVYVCVCAFHIWLVLSINFSWISLTFIFGCFSSDF